MRCVTRPDPYSLLPMMVLDAGVVRDLADALDGRWTPEGESDPLRRSRLLASARLRLYGERDRCGWYVVTYREARSGGMARGYADWSVGFLPDISRFEDSPPEDEVQALARVHLESGMEAEAGLALAYAVLNEDIKAIVTAAPRNYRHNRDFDLPDRLEILGPEEAFALFDIHSGEVAPLAPPTDSPLAHLDWWVP